MPEPERDIYEEDFSIVEDFDDDDEEKEIEQDDKLIALEQGIKELNQIASDIDKELQAQSETLDELEPKMQEKEEDQDIEQKDDEEKEKKERDDKEKKDEEDKKK